MARQESGTPRDKPDRSRNEQQYSDLSRQNREGHRQVERSLKEAARIANGNRPAAGQG
jgi:hypothetical protein